jgi:hypothetical protein
MVPLTEASCDASQTYLQEFVYLCRKSVETKFNMQATDGGDAHHLPSRMKPLSDDLPPAMPSNMIV